MLAQPIRKSVGYRVVAPDQVELGPAAAFLDHWDRSRGAAMAPRWGADYRLSDLPIALVPNVSVVDVIDGGARYYYRFWGTNNVIIKGFEMSQRYLDDSPVACIRENGAHQFAAIIQQQRPLVFLYESAYCAQTTVGCFTIRVPLSSDGETVDKIASYQDLALRRQEWEGLFDTLSGRQSVA